MSEQKYWRQMDIVKTDKLQLPITIIGAGAIGSFACLALAKMGCNNITVYDDDTVDNHNIPNQFYRESDKGKPKVESLKELIKDFDDVDIEINNEKYKHQKLKGIVISAVDSMEVRKQIWKNIKFDPSIKLFIDGRMGGEVMRIYTIKPHDKDEIKFFEQYLYTDKEAEDIKCTATAIIYNVTIIGGLITNQLKKYCMAEEYSKELIFDLKNLVFIKN